MVKKSLHIITGFLLVAPLIAVIYLSVVSNWSFPKLLSGGVTGMHWRSLFSAQSGLGTSFFLSLLISGTVASVSTGFGFVISRHLAQLKNKTRLAQLAYYPYLIAPVVFGIMLQFYFVRLNLTGSFWGVLLAQAVFIFPYSVLLLSTFWNDRVKSIAFQATTLGASTSQLYRSVLVPMAKPWLFICFVQCFLISWFEYGITQLIGVGKVETLTIKTILFVKEANPHLAALAACLMVIPVIILLVVNRRIFLKRIEIT